MMPARRKKSLGSRSGGRTRTFPGEEGGGIKSNKTSVEGYKKARKINDWSTSGVVRKSIIPAEQNANPSWPHSEQAEWTFSVYETFSMEPTCLEMYYFREWRPWFVIPAEHCWGWIGNSTFRKFEFWVHDTCASFLLIVAAQLLLGRIVRVCSINF